MKKILIGVVLFLFFIPGMASAADWYVRPAGGSYGSENGVDYTNAWDGLLNVVWGSGGVEAGDSLYVCGLHVHDLTSTTSIASQASITPISGTSELERVTIRGDCPGDQGIIWGAYRLSHESWIDEGDGVWSITLPASHYHDWFFQDITAGSWVLLDVEPDVNGVRSNPGSIAGVPGFSSGDRLYVHLTEGGNPIGRVYANRFGYRWLIDGMEYITFLNLEIYTHYRFWTPSAAAPVTANNMRFENCTFAYGEHSFITPTDNSDYIEVINCDMSWADNGIYTISNSNNAASYYLFKGNTIHEMGVREVNQNSDAHGIGIQGGHDGIIEDNLIYNTGSGVTLYAYENQELRDTIVRRNIVRDTHTLGGANSFGIETSCDNDALANKSGNKIYQNIVINADTGYKLPFEDEQEVYNNICYNCGTGLFSARSYSGYGPNVKAWNNIMYNSTLYHVYYATSGTTAVANYDYNLYYPDGPTLFRHNSRETNFAEWQNTIRAGSTFDPNSIIADPLFADPENGDFRLQASSPAIDNGTDVGLTIDYEGNSIPQGNGTDIGIYEYVSGSPPPPCTENCMQNDCSYYSDCLPAAGTCPSGEICCSGSCTTPTCSDGTPYGACSSTQPQYCDNGTLVDDCNTCDCPGGYSCQPNGSCQISGGYGDSVALYHFDENFGNIAGDSSGNGNDGTIYDATWTDDSASGYALEFDGLDDYVVVPHNTVLDPDGYGPFSVSLWFRANETTSGDHYLIDKFYNTDRWRVYFNDGGNGRIRVFVRTEGTGPDLELFTTDSDYDDGAWHHFCFTLENNDYIKIYIDSENVKNSSDVWTGYFDFNTRDLHIGRSSTSTANYFEGTIDEVRIYDQTLTAGEILELYSNPGGGQTPGDLNNNGVVDIFDLQIVANDFGKTSGFDPRADAVIDSEIDIFDVVYVASRFT